VTQGGPFLSAVQMLIDRFLGSQRNDRTRNAYAADVAAFAAFRGQSSSVAVVSCWAAILPLHGS
jgi:hypothetical protein